MSKERPVVPKGISTVDAVADAIMVAYAMQPKRKDYDLKEHTDINGFLADATSENCYYSSVDTVYFLLDKYKKLVDNAFLLTTYDFDKGNWVDKDTIFHTYCVIHGKDGYWYAASPANHDPTMENAYALTMIREKKLDNVISSIKKRDGGSWPTPKEIDMIFKYGLNRPYIRVKRRELGIMEIEKKEGKVRSDMIEERFNKNV